MPSLLHILTLFLLLSIPAKSQSPPVIETSQLKDFSKLPEARQKLIETGLIAAKQAENKPYKYGGSTPEDGGFDCSGAMHFILNKAGFKPPRTSADQYLWIQKNSNLIIVPATAKDLTDPIFSSLKPGDLIFWSGTYEPTDNRTLQVTHVAMFLGHETKDNRPVILNASDGRSYRGTKYNGFGVVDLRVPPATGKSRLIAFGSPPGLPSKKPDTNKQSSLPQIEKSITLGVDFLVGYQNPNGSWGSATRTKDLNIYAPLPGAHDAFRAGATGLALSGLIDSQDSRPKTIAAIEKCATWSAEHLPKLRRADQTTTYNIWGHAYGLRSLVRLHNRESSPQKKALYKQLAQQQIDLVNRYEDVNGGFSYLDLFDDITTQRPTGITTSFSSATVLLAMRQARDSMKCKLDEKVISSSLDSIQRQQLPDKSYAYSHSHITRPRTHINRPAGSLARSQACNAALRAFDRKGISDQVIIEWADRFLAREGWLSIARKRPKPHDIHFQISGYFYYYGIFYFTESVSFLPLEKQKPYAEKLAALIISRQEKDGSWWDYPLYDYHQPYGTGYALMALSWCRNTISKP